MVKLTLNGPREDADNLIERATLNEPPTLVMIDGRLTAVTANVQWSQPLDPTAWDTQAEHDEEEFTTDDLRFQSRAREAKASIGEWSLIRTPPPAAVLSAAWIAVKATGTTAGDVRPSADASIDRVLGDLAADQIGKADRRRLGDALDAASKRADGTQARPDEAFGRILRGDGTTRLGIVTP